MGKYWYVGATAPKSGEPVRCYSSMMLALASGNPDNKLFMVIGEPDEIAPDFNLKNFWEQTPPRNWYGLGSVTVSNFTCDQFHLYSSPVVESIARNMAKLCNAPAWVTESFTKYDPIVSMYIRAKLLGTDLLEEHNRSRSMHLELIGWQVLDSAHDHDHQGLAKLIDIAGILMDGVVNDKSYIPIFFQIYRDYVMKIEISGCSAGAQK